MTVESKILEHIKNTLSQFGDKYFINSEGEQILKRNAVIEDLDKYDKSLMTALLDDEIIHKNFTTNVADVEIFEVNKFIDMLRYKEYWADSFTKFNNKIGLVEGDKYLENSSDVVLNFPFKDCVLKAGMTKEDVKKSEKVDELFLNETLAKAEIEELLEPKIFVNTTKYDENGKNKAEDIRENDNLIIKGNNLVALNSLKERYAGKIKMIYLDPPYNTGADSFEYNDSFSRSAWLTFIKNRLELAIELLNNQGVLLIQTSFHQFPYLRVLADEVLDKNKHLFDLNVLVRHPDRALTADKPFNDVMEYTLIYSKNKDYQMPRNLIKKTPDKYTYEVATIGEPDEIKDINGKKVEVYYPEHTKIQKGQASKDKLHRETIRGSLREKNSSGRFYVAYLEKLRDQYPDRTIFKVPDMGDDSLGYRYFELPKSKNVKNGAYYQGMPQSSSVTKKPYANFVNMIDEYNKANKEGVYSFRNGKKPEEFLKYLINIFTNEKDIVMDFFMGSATTQAVAMKMHRQFIGIEQMDYINTVSVPRLQKVIEGEQGGISKEVGWQGGGSFIYAELMEKSQGYLKDIKQASNRDELMNVYNRMKDNSDLDFRIDLNKFENEFQNGELSTLDDLKKELILIIDKNQLYYNYSNIDDEDVRRLISDSDYKFNKSFYA